MYDLGHGVLQDYAQAAFWYRKAAEQGDALAQYYLGNLYDQATACPKILRKPTFGLIWRQLARWRNWLRSIETKPRHT